MDEKEWRELFGEEPPIKSKEELIFLDPLEVLPKEILQLLNPNDFLQAMVDCGELDEITTTYGRDVSSLCKNFIAWFITYIVEQNLKDFKVIEGSFDFINNLKMEHFWLLYKDKYYIDLTLAQFMKSPKLAIVEAKEYISHYHKYKEMSVDTFIKNVQMGIY